MHPLALTVMTRHLAGPGNPSSRHASGRQARRVVEESRETIARSLNAQPSEVVFTSGGTEADNLAVKGIYAARHGHDARRTRARCTLRVTLGHATRQAEVDAFVAAIGPVVERARARAVGAGGMVRIRQGVPG